MNAPLGSIKLLCFITKASRSPISDGDCIPELREADIFVLSLSPPIHFISWNTELISPHYGTEY